MFSVLLSFLDVREDEIAVISFALRLVLLALGSGVCFLSLGPTAPAVTQLLIEEVQLYSSEGLSSLK